MSLVNNAIKWTLICLVEMEMLLFSGMIFGINSLYPALIDLHYFCPSTNITIPCTEQNLHLSYLYVTIVVSTSCSSIPIGYIIDNFGITIIKISCAIMSLFGFVLFALSSMIYHYLIFMACVFIGYFSYACMMGNYAMATLFPQYQSTMVSTFSCSFDFSCIIMTVVALCYKTGVSILWSLSSIGVICSLLCATTATLHWIIKRRSVDTIPNSSITKDSDSTKLLEKGADQHMEERITTRFPTLISALTNRFYIIHVINLSIFILCMNFFLSELILKLNHLFPTNIALVNSLLENSNYVICSGVVLSPFPGLFIDTIKHRNNKLLFQCDETELYGQYLTPFTLMFVICGVSSQLMYILLLVPQKEAIYVAYTMFMILRVTLFSTNSIYLLNAFPKKYFGQLLGIGLFISGSLSFIQYGILFKDQRRLDIVNYSIIALVFLSYLHPILLNFKLPGDHPMMRIDGKMESLELKSL